jgi:LPXTG-motif cell wall-anchored protein
MAPGGIQPAGLPATLAPGESIVVSAGSFVRDTTTNTVTAVAGSPAVESEPATAVADVDPDTFSVSGVAFFDRNRNGVQDDGEPLLPGVEVVLEPTGGVGPAEVALASLFAGPAFDPGDRRTPRSVTTTGTTGRYSFPVVSVGDYVVRSATFARGVLQTNDTDGGSDWSVLVSVIDRPVVSFFAAVGQGTLQGRVFNQGDGSPIPNARLACVWDGPDETMGTADDVTFNSVADANGNYVIDGLPFGEFSCTATDPVTGKSQTFSAVIDSEVPVVVDVVFASVELVQAPVTPQTPQTPAISRPAAPRLPATGASVLALVAMALTMLVGGSAMVATSRRRRR